MEGDRPLLHRCPSFLAQLCASHLSVVIINAVIIQTRVADVSVYAPKSQKVEVKISYVLLREALEVGFDHEVNVRRHLV